MNLPISLIAPARVTASTPPGLLLPHKESGPTVFAFLWEAKPYVVHLDGRSAFQFAEIKAGYVANGTLIHDIEFLVDIESRYDAVRERDPIGALVIQGGTLFIMASRIGNPLFDDPMEVPLLDGLTHWDTEEKVGFARWSMAARVNGKLQTVWTYEGQTSET